MKKITLITMQLKTPGGIERFVCTLAQMFSKKYQVEIIVNYGTHKDSLAFPIPKNVKLSFLSEKQPKEVSLKNILLTMEWQKIPQELKRRYQIKKDQNKVFKEYLKNLQTDYIITDRALYSSIVGKYYNGDAKKIATDHNFHQNNRIYIKTLLRSIKGFHALIVATEELQKFYQNKAKNIRCFYIPNPLPYIPTQKSNLNTKNLLSIGRFVPEKDFLTLIKVMSEVHATNPDIHLTIIGNGVQMPLIKKEIKNLKLEKNISLPGYLKQSEIEKYYYNSSLFVMTSKTEAFGLVLSEAMSYGLPCIAFKRASGARAQINSKTGILIENSNIHAMASSIIKTINNHALLKQYQTNISAYIQQLTPETIFNLWEQILQ